MTLGPTRFQDVELRILIEAFPRFDITYEAGPAGDIWLDRSGKTYLLDEHEGIVSGLSLFHACAALGLDELEFYAEVVGQTVRLAEDALAIPRTPRPRGEQDSGR